MDQQEAFIASLKLQPLVVVLRPSLEDFDMGCTNKPLLLLIEQLRYAGIRHIEIAWSSHPSWKSLIQEIKACFSNLKLLNILLRLDML